MGLNFDSNGKYIGWSNLFDYSSLKTLEASEYLPVPTNRHYTFEKTGLDISNYVDRIVEAKNNKDSVARIKAQVDLLNYLKDQNKTTLSYNGAETDDFTTVLEEINLHEKTKLPQSLSEGSQKNFISSHIQNTIQDIRNMVRAYSPIDMDVFRDASTLSPKTAESAQLTLLDPATKFIMQFQNITGKNVIGIAANGEKGSFMWHYYLNDMIEHPERYNLENGWFEFKTTRIFGRSTPAGPSEVTINTLPNVRDAAKWAKENPEKTIFQITDNLAVDLMISQVLSAATDRNF